MHIEDYIPEAIQMVSAWGIPDEELADEINVQVRLMAGVAPDETGPDTH